MPESADANARPKVVLTGNLAYIKAYAAAVEAAGAQPERQDIMQLEKTATPDRLFQILTSKGIENIIFSRREHVEMFLDLVQEDDEGPARIRPFLQEKPLFFTLDDQSFKLLNDAGMPVLRSPGPKSIDLVEYFLRLRRTGPVLAPCVDPEQEEAPEFLSELKLAMHYLPMYESRPYQKDKLEAQRKKFDELQQEQKKEARPLHVLLHEPGTITQFMVAFPNADYSLEALHFLPLHKKTQSRLAHLGLAHSEVLPWHPDNAKAFSYALRQAILDDE